MSSSVGPCTRIISLFAGVLDSPRPLPGLEGFQTSQEHYQVLSMELQPWRARLDAHLNTTCTRATMAVLVGRDWDPLLRLHGCWRGLTTVKTPVAVYPWWLGLSRE